MRMTAPPSLRRRRFIQRVEEFSNRAARSPSLELADEDLPARQIVALARPALADLGRIVAGEAGTTIVPKGQTVFA